MAESRTYDLEDRLVKFAVKIIEVCDLLPKTKSASNLENQISRSGIALALMYGEAQAAESRADFIHKIKMLLKELRETRIALRIIHDRPMLKHTTLDQARQECNELIGIFTASVETAKKNRLQ
ncbi:MAG: four helix bundle protein [Chitinophagaceae bacterium]|nr:four helix bundle protein [Chitinophagaceae bacterium]